MNRRLRVVHAVHDFLPRHRAGSELYVAALGAAQSPRHDVFVLAAEYDPSTPHGTLRWREHSGLPVIELINNWEFRSFEESWSSPRLDAQLAHALDAVAPDVVHIHNLLNLSFDLPRLARERGARTVATLHDYTLVCPSGGQRVHVADAHVCDVIDPDRCARCFVESPFHAQMAASRFLRKGRRFVGAASKLARRAPWLLPVVHKLPAPALTGHDIRRRLAAARTVLDSVDLFVAPSVSLADEFVRLGLPPNRLVVSDYGFPGASRVPRSQSPVLRIGFVGTVTWHKGVHVLLEALPHLRGRYEVHLFGDPQTFPAYTARLRRLTGGLPVAFEGSFSRDRVGEVYAGLDVLVVCSLWPENSPLVVHEAFMHGTAVVAARTGGLRDLVRHEVDGLLYDPFSPSALAAALQRFIDDPSLAGRLASAAPPVKTIADDAKEWEERYEAVIQGGFSGGRNVVAPAAAVCR